MRYLWVLLVVAACGKSAPSGKATETCEKAADRWVACAREMLGDEMAAIAESKRDIEACARDERTVAMYDKCLAAADCQKMMDCMMGEAGVEP